MNSMMILSFVQLWDLTAGKLLTDLRLHTAGVNVVEFHPNELLLSSGSSDRYVAETTHSRCKCCRISSE